MSDRPTKRDREIPEKRFEDERENIIAWLEKADDLSSNVLASDALQYIRSLEHRAIDRDADIEALERQMAELEGQVSEYEQLRAIEMAARRVLVHESIPLTHAVLANTLDAMTRQRAAREAAQ